MRRFFTRGCCRRALPRRSVSLLLALLALPFVLAAPLRAQTDGVEPWITFSPGTGTFTSPSILVTVRFSDNASIKTSTRWIQFNGQAVTTQFTHSAVNPGMGGVTMTSTGTLTLVAGTNTLKAHICDNAATSLCSDTTIVTYTYVPGQPGVRVLPDGGTIPAVGGTTQVHTFTVQNPGTAAGTYRLRPECRDGWTGAPHAPCTVSSSTVSLAAGASANATVSTTSAAGRVLLVRLSAELESMAGVADAGWVDVNVAGSSGTAAPKMEARIVDLATGVYLVQRSQCVTASAGPGAAFECGDLRLAHALPAHRTMNRAWAPVLMYNSQHADPRPSVYLDVTLPEGKEVPGIVSPALYFPASGAVVQRFFGGSDWQAGTTRRIAVQTDAMATGWYQFNTQVLSTSSHGQSSSEVIYTALSVVNRSGSAFGAGWWLAGLEQLVPIDGYRMLWVGGDGSTRRYDYVYPGVWVWSDPAGPADTLGSSPTAAYLRKLPEGGRVEFDGTGQHVRTINRLGQTTTFQWTSGRLTRVVVPTASGTAPAYDFTYSNGVLASVSATAPGAPTRTVTLGHELSDGRVTYIQDPDGKRVLFAYAGTRPNLVTRRTDRRGTPVTFTWSTAGRLASTRMGVATGDSIIGWYEAVEDKGFTASVPVSQAYTALDGPRTDVTDRTLLWMDERGAVRRVRDPVGGETVLTRGDSRFPALVTEVRAPDARGDSLVLRSSAAYDARGRVTSSTAHDPLGDVVNLVTTYGWDDAVDRPVWVKAPGADTVRMAYDPITRNPLWQQQGGQSRRVWFDYNAAGQVVRIRYPDATTGDTATGGKELLAYDARGNLKRTVSPLGFVTLMYRDALGRVTETISPVHAGSSSDSASVANTGLRSTVAYDIMDRDTLSVTYGRAMTLNRLSTVARLHTTDAEAVTVRTTYDDGGLLLEVRRWSTPDTAHIGVLTVAYVYDAAGRKTSESDDSGADEFYMYDPAGNVVQHLTKRGHPITMSYDALGRMTRRVTPPVIHTSSSVNCSDPYDPANPNRPRWNPCTFTFPRFPNNAAGGWTIPADTAYFSFDAMGSMVRAQNGDAIVSRTYYPGGALRTDSLRIRAYGAGSFSQHAYGLEYRYDGAGRTRALLHPSNLAGAAQRDSFAYEPVTGGLQLVKGRTNLEFGYGYDLLGRLTSETMPSTSGTLGNTYIYDLDGRRTSRTGVYGETFTYDARGKVLSAAVAGRSTFRNYYSGVGNLVATEWDNDNNAADEVEEFRLDALGHQVWRRSANNNTLYHHPEYTTRYTPGTSRVNEVQFTFPPRTEWIDSTVFVADTTFRTYDAAGSVQEGWERGWNNSQGSGYRKVQTRSYYGADDKLRAQQGYSELGGMYFTGERRGYFSEYRYDALGRRVLVRTRRDGLCQTTQTNTVDCTSGIERYVWAGDNILWEMRGPGANTEPAERLEQVDATGMEFGIVGYTHAGGVDRPLVAYKTAGGNAGAVVVPHMNWRGLFSLGTNPSGGASSTPVEWPGFRTTANHSMGETQATTKNWMGSLLEDKRDAGGLMYMRNRYYDPATGQFTQTDPIGLAGGLNTYGFAAGDPVTYGDPYGLWIDFKTDEARALWNEAAERVNEALRSDDRRVRSAARRLRDIMNDAFSDPGYRYELTVQDYDEESWETHTGGGWEKAMEPGRHIVQVDTRTNPDVVKHRTSPWIVLVHELGGAQAYRRGNPQHEGGLFSAGPAVGAENAARKIAGCRRRWNHAGPGPDCTR